MYLASRQAESQLIPIMKQTSLIKTQELPGSSAWWFTRILKIQAFSAWKVLEIPAGSAWWFTKQAQKMTTYLQLLPEWHTGIIFRSRPGKPNQRKGQNEKFMNFAPFCEFWFFSLGKQARFTLNSVPECPCEKFVN